MRSTDDPLATMDVERYVHSQKQLRTLKSQLPLNIVENLAREVIRRFSESEQGATFKSPTPENIELLCRTLLSDDDHAGAHFIEGIRSGGASIEEVYLNYLARAAQMLGTWWDNDQVSFVDVTLGTSRMYAIMRGLRHQFASTQQLPTRSAVFVSMPGETHTLGVRMATDLFRKEGWDIELKVGMSHDDLIDEIKHSGTIVIGVSAGGEHAVESLSKLILALRISNPRAAIFVSGQIVDEASDIVALMDLDGIAQDLPSAKALMERFWNEALDVNQRA